MFAWFRLRVKFSLSHCAFFRAFYESVRVWKREEDEGGCFRIYGECRTATPERSAKATRTREPRASCSGVLSDREASWSSLRQPAASSSTAPPQSLSRASCTTPVTSTPRELLPPSTHHKRTQSFRSPTNSRKMKKVKTIQRKGEKQHKILYFFHFRPIKSNKRRFSRLKFDFSKLRIRQFTWELVRQLQLNLCHQNKIAKKMLHGRCLADGDSRSKRGRIVTIA